MSDAEDDFDAADSGAADCTPIEAGAVRKGNFLLHQVIKGKPCKVVDTSKAKVGKHGAAKCSFTGIDLFTGKKLECVCPASAQLAQPIVDRTEYTLMDIDEDSGAVSLLDGSNETRDDLNMPEADDVVKKIRGLFDDGKEVVVTVLKAVGQEQIIDCKEAAAGK